MVDVISTKTFRNNFSVEANYDKFVSNFIKWKELPKGSEHKSRFFGKDGGYREPKLSDGSYLMHVHTYPTDPIQRKKWEQDFQNDNEKTSDGALINAKSKDSYLMIDWIRNGAHEETNYTEKGKAALRLYASQAEEFIDGKKIFEQLKYLALEAKLLFAKDRYESS